MFAFFEIMDRRMKDVTVYKKLDPPSIGSDCSEIKTYISTLRATPERTHYPFTYAWVESGFRQQQLNKYSELYAMKNCEELSRIYQKIAAIEKTLARKT